MAFRNRWRSSAVLLLLLGISLEHRSCIRQLVATEAFTMTSGFMTHPIARNRQRRGRRFSSITDNENPSAGPPAEQKPRKKPKNPWAANDADLLHRAYTKSRFESLETPDYIVIGSGIGGLWLAAALAKFNKTCVVLEQHYTAGGLQHTFRSGGYEFVPGLHYIANLPLCAPLYQMVADNSTQIVYKRSGDSVPADKHELSSHDLKIGDLPIMHVREGLHNARDELCRYFPEEAPAIDEFLRIMERAKWQAGQFSTFKIFPRWLQFLMSQLVCSTYIHYASMTTEEALSELTSDGRLKTVLSAFGGDLGESITDGSFAMQAAVLGHVLEGCYYPEGGPPQFAPGNDTSDTKRRR
jgi:hypothetical protein